MIDNNDLRTVDLFPLPRGRGRPKTGNALSGAERARRYRERQAALLAEQRELLNKLLASQTIQ